MVRRRKRGHLVTIARVLEKEQLDLFGNLCGRPLFERWVHLVSSRTTYLCRTESIPPFCCELGEHAEGSELLVFAQATVDRQFIVRHAL